MKQQAHLLKLYVIFSATRRSPMSNVGNMDSDGINRGSAMNLHQPCLRHIFWSVFCACKAIQKAPELAYLLHCQMYELARNPLWPMCKGMERATHERMKKEHSSAMPKTWMSSLVIKGCFWFCSPSESGRSPLPSPPPLPLPSALLLSAEQRCCVSTLAQCGSHCMLLPHHQLFPLHTVLTFWQRGQSALPGTATHNRSLQFLIVNWGCMAGVAAWVLELTA